MDKYVKLAEERDELEGRIDQAREEVFNEFLDVVEKMRILGMSFYFEEEGLISAGNLEVNRDLNEIKIDINEYR